VTAFVPPAVQEPRERVWERDLVLVLSAIVAMFVSVHSLLGVAPLVIEEAGGSSTTAGLVNALFYGLTVPIQLATPRLMSQHDPRVLLSLGLALLGVPALAIAVWPTVTLIFISMLFRGVGFAVISVVVIALVAEVAPATRRGEALGLAGLAVGVPNVFAPSAGLYLHDVGGRMLPFAVSGAAALTGVVATATITSRTWLRPSRSGTVRRALAQRAALPFFAAMTIVTLTQGSLVTFTPLVLARQGAGSAAVFLLCAGSANFVARWASGRVVDRRGSAKLLAPAFAVALAGLVALAADFREPSTVIIGAICFGTGLGAVSTALQALLFARSPDYAIASLYWNVAWDLGFALGAVGLGVAASLASYGYAFWLLPFVWMSALGVAVAGHRPAPSLDLTESEGVVHCRRGR
jgi:predicted MFS family arabinose efflux permease